MGAMMAQSSADAIAPVLADLKARRVRIVNPLDRRLPKAALDCLIDPTVIDCTQIYHSLVAKDEPVYLYEDHPSIVSPWEEGAFAYVNEHGNVIVMHATQVEADEERREKWRWDPANPVDWDEVRWLTNVFVWIGGRSPAKGPIPTSGPVHLWQFAINPDGSPADLHWVQLLPHYPMEHWDMAQLVVLGALDFLNCRNVTIREPARPRAQRRRLERTGIRVNELVVKSLGSSIRSGRSGDTASMPLTSVRGHFALYGPKYERGLLFGKLEGRFWIPQHARGNAEVGEVQKSYTIEPTQEVHDGPGNG